MCRKFILLIDDEEDDHFIFKEAIQALESPVELLQAYGCEQAFTILEQNGKTVSLIFLDLNMPRVNGHEVLNRLKTDNRYYHIPVVIYSTSINHSDQEKCLQSGASLFFSKPGKFNILCQKLQEILTRSF